MENALILHAIRACGSGVDITMVMSISKADFSVVLYRSDSMLFSEKNHVKVHKNQWIQAMPHSPEYLAGAARRGQTTPPEGQKPSQWLCLTKLPREMCPQLIVSKALSWGIIGFAPKVRSAR